jgi:hypothetical protein
MLVSSTSIKAARDTTNAINHGFALGFQIAEEGVSVPAALMVFGDASAETTRVHLQDSLESTAAP